MEPYLPVMASCTKKNCPIDDGSTWPACVGPNGCMRTRPSAKPVRVAHICLEPDMEEVDKILSGGIPVDKIAKVYGPVYRRPKVTPDERNKRNRNSRRSVSVSRDLYAKLKESARVNHRSMSSIVEEECAIFFGDSVKDSDS